MEVAPQFIKNYRNGSTAGMSIFMVLGWLWEDWSWIVESDRKKNFIKSEKMDDLLKMLSRRKISQG